ncbi:unnamed protein product [Adineta ricciae]|uniref:Uncharacterized protein n=1 Tax=Adineta ricciae TaxID=249248 RepID=A0A815VCP6_ADIRI|nr:unnamed protein product [Adineta ricciae]CAF1649450.1 unnamed protein product [Adineta ricciae]
MPPKINKQSFIQNHQETTNLASSSNSDNEDDNDIVIIPPPSNNLAAEILLDINRFLKDENQRLKVEIENLKAKLFEKTTIDSENCVLRLDRVALNQTDQEQHLVL